jgi:hypothetical protein
VNGVFVTFEFHMKTPLFWTHLGSSKVAPTVNDIKYKNVLLEDDKTCVDETMTHFLLFDGPGMGRNPFDCTACPFRQELEAALTAVINFCSVSHSQLDSDICAHNFE